MMINRFNSIGIKQVIRIEWLEKATNLLLAGLSTREIRSELHQYLANHPDYYKNKSPNTRAFAVNMVMTIWVDPHEELIDFRNSCLEYLRKANAPHLPLHWSMVTATCPFWRNVAEQTGRVLKLQEQVTQKQVSGRITRKYGERSTVERSLRRTIRSFVVWHVLNDTKNRGCYESLDTKYLPDKESAILLLESVLQSTQEKKCTLSVLFSSPAFFPFKMPIITAQEISYLSSRMTTERMGFEDDLIRLDR